MPEAPTVDEGPIEAATEPVSVLLSAGVSERKAVVVWLPAAVAEAPPLAVAPLGLPPPLCEAIGEALTAGPLPVCEAEASFEGLPEPLPDPGGALAVAAPIGDGDAAMLRVAGGLIGGVALPRAEVLAEPLPVESILPRAEALPEPLLVAPTEKEMDAESRPLGDAWDGEAGAELDHLALPVRATVAVCELHALALIEREAVGEATGERLLERVLDALPLGGGEGEARPEREGLPLCSGDAEAEGKGVPLALCRGEGEELPQSVAREEGEGAPVSVADGVAREEGEGAPVSVADAVPPAAVAEGELVNRALTEAAPDSEGAEGVASGLRDSPGVALPESSGVGDSGALPDRGGLLLAVGEGEPLYEALLLPEGVCDALCVGAAPEALPLALALPSPLREALGDADAAQLADAVAHAVAVGAAAEPLCGGEGEPMADGDGKSVRVALSEIEEAGDREADDEKAAEADGDPQLEARSDRDGAALPEGSTVAETVSEVDSTALPVAATEGDGPGERLSKLSVARAVGEGNIDAVKGPDGDAKGVWEGCGADAVLVAQMEAPGEGEEAGDGEVKGLLLAHAVL